MKYLQLDSDEWFQPTHKDFKMACCDCQLVHDMKFRWKDGHFQFKATRNERATAAMRRHKRRKTTA